MSTQHVDWEKKAQSLQAYVDKIERELLEDTEAMHKVFDVFNVCRIRMGRMTLIDRIRSACEKLTGKTLEDSPEKQDPALS